MAISSRRQRREEKERSRLVLERADATVVSVDEQLARLLVAAEQYRQRLVNEGAARG